MLSKTCEYGIRAVVHIAHRSQADERVSLKAIAEAINSPVAFTGKIMQQLTRSGLVQSVKGPSGGFWMDEQSRKTVTIRDVVEVIDGKNLYVTCGLGLAQCNDAQPCPVHQEYMHIRKALDEMHSKTYIDDLATRLNADARLR